MNVDIAYEKFLEIQSYGKANREGIWSEQDARFQMIDLLITEVLGWDRASIKTELSLEEGRLDYLLSHSERNIFVIEAKKADSNLIDSKLKKLAYYKYNGPACKSALSALRQAEMYCLDAGVQFCAVTNGFEWIGHWPIRGDGRNKSEYKIIVFPDHDTIEQNFSKFYELFSQQGVSNSLYKVYINEQEGLSIHQSESLLQIKNPQHLQMLSKSNLARDIDKVFTNFFSSMSGDDDPEMLISCFVESRESRETDFSLQKIARNIIDQISYIQTHPQSLEAEIKDALTTSKGDFVLIIGNKGSGKSTYIDRFFKSTLESELRSKCLVLRVDLRNSPGSTKNLTEWLDEYLSKLCEKMLFSDQLTWDNLLGVYFREYNRWRNGEMKHLYETDKNQFKIEFGRFIEKQISEHTAKYLANMLWHTVGARQQMPCVIFDNADHFPKEFQEAVFQYAQSLHRTVPNCFVICPVTDRTIWQLSKNGPLQSYHYKAFYLPTPSTKEILQKRVAFLQSKIDKENSSQSNYFLTKGIRINLQDLQAFAACIESVFLDTDYISKLISSLCNYDIRRSLELTKKTLTSPHIAIDDLVRTFLSESSRLRISSQKIKKAIFLGDYNQFSQTENSFIVNLYAIHSEQISSPLARLSILQALKYKSHQSPEMEAQYMEIHDLATYLEPIGITKTVTWKHLEELFKYRLIESYEPTNETLSESTRVKITPAGLTHIDLGLNDEIYVEQIGLCTAIRTGEPLFLMKDILHSRKMTQDDWKRVNKIFIEYLLKEDMIFCPNAHALDGQEIIRASLRRLQPDN